MKTYKYRHELKFKISLGAAKLLQKKLSLFMDIDKNANKDGKYLIKSLYFDDHNSNFYYEKLDGVLYRKKFRIRTYNNDENFIRLEKKVKHNNLTAKEQTLITRDIYNKILKGNYNGIKSKGLLEEFLLDIKTLALIPSIIVSYHRTAFIYPVSDVRITFDEDIRSGRYNYSLFDNNKITYKVDEDDKIVMEVKFNEVLPLHIANMISEIPSCREAVSKFAICRSIK